MCVSNPDRLSLRVIAETGAETRFGFTEIVPNSFPVPFHATDSGSLHEAIISDSNSRNDARDSVHGGCDSVDLR